MNTDLNRLQRNPVRFLRPTGVRTRLFALRPTRMVVRTPSSHKMYLCFQQLAFTPPQRQRRNSHRRKHTGISGAS